MARPWRGANSGVAVSAASIADVTMTKHGLKAAKACLLTATSASRSGGKARSMPCFVTAFSSNVVDIAY